YYIYVTGIKEGTAILYAESDSLNITITITVKVDPIKGSAGGLKITNFYINVRSVTTTSLESKTYSKDPVVTAGDTMYFYYSLDKVISLDDLTAKLTLSNSSINVKIYGDPIDAFDSSSSVVNSKVCIVSVGTNLLRTNQMQACSGTLNLYYKGELISSADFRVSGVNSEYKNFISWVEKVGSSIWDSSMNECDMMKAFTAYLAHNYDHMDYSEKGTGGYTYPVVYGYNGDCWTYASTLIRIARYLGLEADSYFPYDNAPMHMVCVFEYNGLTYEADAGWSGTAPRGYSFGRIVVS
ncbi:MAG: hypothetical protein LUI07_05125, partial [Lachnospiraceae bacterium]|nr:hypothetical protein [Lachnospiraceae bacterium]